MTDDLKNLTSQLYTQERMQYAINAFASLVESYGLAEHLQDIKVNDLPQLIDDVEKAVIATVRDFKSNKAANDELHQKLQELFAPKENETESATY